LELPDDALVQDAQLRAIYLETLRRHLPTEQRRRAAENAAQLRRAEAQRRAKAEEARRAEECRVARVRSTPVFRELTDFAAQVRNQDHENHGSFASDDLRLIASLFQQLANAQRKVLEEWTRRQDNRAYVVFLKEWRKTIEKQVSEKRAQVKERFRSYPGFDQSDRTLFDRLVDKELDDLLKQVLEPYEDDFVEGLRLLTGK